MVYAYMYMWYRAFVLHFTCMLQCALYVTRVLSCKCRVFYIKRKIREAVRNQHSIVANPRPVSHILNDHGLSRWNSLDLMNNPCLIPIGSFTPLKFRSRQSYNKCLLAVACFHETEKFRRFSWNQGNIRVYPGLLSVSVLETDNGLQTMHEVI